jgi:Cys-rich protein (TIGR01571 family)
MRKAFGMSFIKQMLLVLLCVAPHTRAGRAVCFRVLTPSRLRHRCLYGAQFFSGLFAAVDCGPPPVTVSPLGGATSDVVVNSTDVEQAHQYDSCMAKWNILDLLYIPLTLGFLIYAAYRRFQMRKRFNIPGDEWADYFSWLCCGPCALCQETRTLAGNSVEDGYWPEEKGNGSGEQQPLIFGQPNFVKQS